MTQFMQWFVMGGYSLYVWPAYGLVGLVLVSTIFGARLQSARTREKLQRFKRNN